MLRCVVLTAHDKTKTTYCFAAAVHCLGLGAAQVQAVLRLLNLCVRHLICLREAPVTLKELISVSLTVYLEVHPIPTWFSPLPLTLQSDPTYITHTTNYNSKFSLWI